MSDDWVVYVCLLLGLSSALVAGVFLTFSDFVMRGLMLSAPAGGIESMQHINRTVFKSAFLNMLLGLVPITLGFAGYAWFKLNGSGQILISLAAVIYLVTVFLVTIVGNLPMNERLAALPFASPEVELYWSTYGRVWTWWNHVRTFGSIVTASCFFLAAISLA